MSSRCCRFQRTRSCGLTSTRPSDASRQQAPQCLQSNAGSAEKSSLGPGSPVIPAARTSRREDVPARHTCPPSNVRGIDWPGVLETSGREAGLKMGPRACGQHGTYCEEERPARRDWAKKKDDGHLTGVAFGHRVRALVTTNDGSSVSPPVWANPTVDQRIIEALVAHDSPHFKELTDQGVSRESIRAHARNLGLTDRFIKECRLTGSRPAMRVCVKCDTRFLSSGIHNRLCRRCPPR